MRWLLALGLACALTGSAFAQPTPETVLVEGGEGQEATSESAVTASLESLAKEVDAGGATAARISHFDIAWPATPEEQRALGGYTIVLISTVTAQRIEHPQARAYARVGDEEVSLVAIARRQVAVDPRTMTAHAVGHHREDVFYLAPIAPLLEDGALLVDFSANRTAFRVSALPLAPPDFVREGLAPAPAAFEERAAVEMLLREYSGFTGLAPAEPAP